MNLLAIDTSTDIASLALSYGDKISFRNQEGIQQHATHILPLIDELLKEASITVADLDGIIVGLGPGSFTGLRIALSVAKGLAFSHDIPLYGFHTHDIIADTLHTKEDALILVDARMNELYWKIFYKDGTTTDIKVTKPEMISINSSKYIIAGVGFEPYEALLTGLNLDNCVTMQEIYPKAASMISLFHKTNPSILPLEHVEPLYVRNHVTQGKPNG